MESVMEVSSEAMDTNQLIYDDQSPNFCDVNKKYMVKRPAPSSENDVRKVPKLSCLHLSPNATTCDLRIFPASITEGEVDSIVVDNQVGPQCSVKDMTVEGKIITPAKSGKDINKLLAQKIAIGM